MNVTRVIGILLSVLTLTIGIICLVIDIYYLMPVGITRDLIIIACGAFLLHGLKRGVKENHRRIKWNWLSILELCAVLGVFLSVVLFMILTIFKIDRHWETGLFIFLPSLCLVIVLLIYHLIKKAI